jgi:hypothetical protein
LALVGALAGCGEQSRADRVNAEPPPCDPERSRPVGEARLKAVLERHGIHLYRDDRCEEFKDLGGDLVPGAPQATLGNVRNSREYDRVVSTEGQIFCELDLGGPIGSRQRRATRLTRIKYEGDEETHLGIFNVTCAIYPDSPGQVDRLAAALLDLRSAA